MLKSARRQNILSAVPRLAGCAWGISSPSSWSRRRCWEGLRQPTCAMATRFQSTGWISAGPLRCIERLCSGRRSEQALRGSWAYPGGKAAQGPRKGWAIRAELLSLGCVHFAPATCQEPSEIPAKAKNGLGTLVHAVERSLPVFPSILDSRS